MSTKSLVERESWVRWCSALFVVGLILWTAASIVLAVPHGEGHSIESMRLFDFVRDVSFPMWLGGFVGILGALALQTLRSTRRTVAD